MGNLLKTHSLKEAFYIQPGEVISLVGAGGKTTLMFSLARELVHEVDDNRALIVTTTTTKISTPSPSDSPQVFLSTEEQELVDFITKSTGKVSSVTLASKKINNTLKLKGLESAVVDRLSCLESVRYTVIEADGAAMRSLKAPDISFEPVIPGKTTLVIPIVGIDAVGKPLSDENVFRAEIASRLTNIPMGAPVSLDTISTLITHPSGLVYGSPISSRIVPLINKIDLKGGYQKASELAQRLLKAQHPRLDRIVLGQVNATPPVLEIFNRKRY